MTKSHRFMKKKKNRQEKAQYELQLKRIKNIMMNFKKPYNILSEFKGQAGEIMLRRITYSISTRLANSKNK
jgi:ribosomal protein S18